MPVAVTVACHPISQSCAVLRSGTGRSIHYPSYSADYSLLNSSAHLEQEEKEVRELLDRGA